jgi:hypothetical protein
MSVVGNKSPSVVRIYLPPTPTACSPWPTTVLRSTSYVNVIVADKYEHPQLLDMEAAIEHCTTGIGIWDWASNDQGTDPDVVMAGCGDVSTLEALAATALLRQSLRDVKIRFVNVVDLFKLTSQTEHPHGLTEAEYESVFTPDKPVVFNFHSYPWLVHKLTYRRRNQSRLHVRGYKEKGNIDTPLELMIRNQTDRFSLAIDAIDRMPRFQTTAAHVRDDLVNRRIASLRHAHDVGADPPGSACSSWTPLLALEAHSPRVRRRGDAESPAVLGHGLARDAPEPRRGDHERVRSATREGLAHGGHDLALLAGGEAGDPGWRDDGHGPQEGAVVGHRRGADLVLEALERQARAAQVVHHLGGRRERREPGALLVKQAPAHVTDDALPLLEAWIGDAYQDHLPPGAQHATHLRDGARPIGEPVVRAVADDEVERGIVEREMLGVAHLERRGDAGGDRLPARLVDHPRRDVDAVQPTAWSEDVGHFEQVDARTAPQVEHGRRGAYEDLRKKPPQYAQVHHARSLVVDRRGAIVPVDECSAHLHGNAGNLVACQTTASPGRLSPCPVSWARRRPRRAPSLLRYASSTLTQWREAGRLGAEGTTVAWPARPEATKVSWAFSTELGQKIEEARALLEVLWLPRCPLCHRAREPGSCRRLARLLGK